MRDRRDWLKKAAVAAAVVASLCLSTPARAQDAGEKVYKTKCAMCHAPDGSGKTAMGDKLKISDLRSEDVQKLKDADLNKVIAKGKNKMPAYGDKLSGKQIANLVSYVRELGKKR